MLASPQELFTDALKHHYAIGAFNVSNLEMSQAVIWGAMAMNSPVIIQTSEGAVKYAGINALSSMILALAKEAGVPVILHLDHGKSLDTIKQCIEAGYNSVMIDASKKSFEENIAITKEATDYAHDRGVWVEAELGAILGKEGIKDLKGEQTPDSFLTDPKQANEFVEKTGIDALACSVGTIHGAFSGQEYIRFELLDEVQDAIVDFPLVLHGASGLADAHLKRAVKTNVCKVNVDTELRIAFEQAIKAYFDEKHDFVDPREILGPAREAFQKVVESKIKLFGSSKK